MLYWKKHFFHAYVVNDSAQLELAWRSCSNLTTMEESTLNVEEEGNHCFDLNSDSNDTLSEYRHLESPKPYHKSLKSQLISTPTYFDRFDLGSNTNGTFLEAGFSFDPASRCRVPVLLVQLENVLKQSKTSNQFACQQNVQMLLLGIQDSNSVSHGCEEKRFSLVPLRLFSLGNQCDTFKSLRFISDYGLFYIYPNKEDNQITFQIWFGQHGRIKVKSTDSKIQNFTIKWTEDLKLCDSEFHIMDVFNSFINKTILALIQSLHSNTCGAFLFLNVYGTKYELKKVRTDVLFPSQFADITNTIRILSLSTRSSTPIIKSSSLIMLTSTHYAIQFVNGKMTHCVSLDKSFQPCQNVKDLSSISLNVIDCPCDKGLKTVININGTCFLVDWSNEKLELLFPEGVCMIGRCEDGSSDAGKMHLSVLVISGTLEKHDLTKCMISNIEISKIMDTKGKEEEKPKVQRIGKMDDDDDNDNEEDVRSNMGHATKNVLNGLVFQEKKCRLDAMNMEQILRCKETFIQQTLKSFSGLKDNGKACLKTKHLDLPPLVPLTNHSEIWGANDANINMNQSHWKIENLWKRTIDKLLVVGVDLIQLSPEDYFSDIYLILVPINPNQKTLSSKSLLVPKPPFNSVPSVSSPFSSPSKPFTISAESSSPPRKKSCLNIPHQIPCDSSNLSKRSSLLKVSAFLDTQDFWGCEDINIQVYLSYLLLDRTDLTTKDYHRVNCGIVSVSQKEKLEESFSLKSSMKNFKEKDFLNANDIAALECIQVDFDLQVSSILNPVTSLLENIRSLPSITFLPRFGCYIYSDDHRLQFSRLQWLEQSDRCNAFIRVSSRTQDDFLLFVEFLVFISPPDISINIHEYDKSRLNKSWSILASSLHEKVDKSFCQISKELEKVTVSIPIEKIDEDVEIIADFPSPKFHSSVQKSDSKGKESKIFEHQIPSTSGVEVLAESFSCEKDTISITSEMEDDLNQFDFGNGFASKAEIEGKKRKGLGTKKNSKSKLMTKKK